MSQEDDIEPRLHDPDWGRYRVALTGRIQRVGDPTRWGATVQTVLVPPPDGAWLYTPQIVQVGTRDSYSRNWSLLGQLTLPANVFDQSFPGTYPDPAPNSINVLLELVMGVGQIQIVQQIVLAAGGNASFGLCNQQDASNGGPYAAIADRQGSSPTISKSFAVIGGLIGNAIAIRGIYQFGTPANEWNSQSILSLLVTPYAAGEGL